METRRIETEVSYADTLGLRLLRALAARGHYVFTIEEARQAAAHVGVADSYLHLLLSRMVAGGWLTRIRRGLYAPANGLPWDVDVPPFVIATHLVTPSAISHWSALSYHGLTEQIPQVVTAFTPQKVVTPSMRRREEGKEPTSHAWEIGGVRYEYMTVKLEHYFGIEEVWVDEHFRVPITDRERTVLEGFITPRMFGSIGEVLGIVEEHVHDLDLGKLIAYAQRYGKASVAKRLGWSLEQAGVSDDTLAPLAAIPVSGFRILDPTRPRRGPCDPRWHIQNNLTATAT